MPIQTFTGEGAEPIAELRWEFDFETIELLYRGRMLGRLNNIDALKDRGIIVTTPDKRSLDVHFEPSKAGGEFRVFLDTDEHIRELVRAQKDAGVSTRDAVDAVARELGLPRKRVYGIAVSGK
jgi:hypothetical protein